MSERKLPKFNSEVEEAAFYDANQDRIQDFFQPVGTPPDPGLGYDPAELQGTKLTTIRLAHNVLDLASKVAKARGMKQQTLMKSLLHESLVNEAKRLGIL